MLSFQVFFNAEHLGGNDDVQRLHQQGQLQVRGILCFAVSQGFCTSVYLGLYNCTWAGGSVAYTV